MGACVEKSNLVVLDKFVPISPQNQCQVSPGGDRYFSKGYIDLAFTRRYLLAFQITNYLSSSKTDGVGANDAQISTAETNMFRVTEVEIEYEWDPRPQADGRRLQLNSALWGVRRTEIHEAIVVDPEGGQAAAAVDIFTEPQAKDLLRVVEQTIVDSQDGVDIPSFDWVASPLIIKLKVIGELGDRTKVATNKLTFNIIPSFGDSIQMSSTYLIPPGGFENDHQEWEQIKDMCAFNNSLVDGCLVGQDYSKVNCHADINNIPGNNEWQKYIATSRCHLVDEDDDCYHVGQHVYSVVEVVYNGYKKDVDDGNYYACCPSELPEEPEVEEEEE
ncbi:MAG TPA: hypothetical protein ENN58_02945 [bacterium]|nr:hypothetical protein [bacterium]